MRENDIQRVKQREKTQERDYDRLPSCDASVVSFTFYYRSTVYAHRIPQSQLELLSALCLNEINKSKKTRGGKKACILQTNVKSIMGSLRHVKCAQSAATLQEIL